MNARVVSVGLLVGALWSGCFNSFIEGSMTAAALADPDDPIAARRGEARRRQTAVRAAQARLAP